MFNFIKGFLKTLLSIAPPVGIRIAYYLFCYPVFTKIRSRERRIREKSKQRSVRIGNRIIKTMSWGKGTKKVLLIHGWGANGGSLGGFTEPLNKLDYTVFTFDGPAHGQSSGRFTNIIEFSEIITTFLKNQSFDLVISHSFGSAAVVKALYDHPEIHIHKIIMLTTPDRLEEIIQGFTNTMNISETNTEKLMQYISNKFGVDVDQMVVNRMIATIKVDHALLIHDINDRVLSFEGAKRVSQAADNVILQPVNGLGHYRILWDNEVIQVCTNFLRLNGSLDNHSMSSFKEVIRHLE